MILGADFFYDPLGAGLTRRYVLQKISGIEVPDWESYDGRDYPLLEGYSNAPIFDDDYHFRLTYNGFVFKCTDNILDLQPQIEEYNRLNRDNTIDGLLNND